MERFNGFLCGRPALSEPGAHLLKTKLPDKEHKEWVFGNPREGFLSLEKGSETKTRNGLRAQA